MASLALLAGAVSFSGVAVASASDEDDLKAVLRHAYSTPLGRQKTMTNLRAPVDTLLQSSTTPHSVGFLIALKRALSSCTCGANPD